MLAVSFVSGIFFKSLFKQIFVVDDLDMPNVYRPCHLDVLYIYFFFDIIFLAS